MYAQNHCQKHSDIVRLMKLAGIVRPAYQTQSTQNTQTVNQFENDVNQTGRYNDQIEYIPAAQEKLFGQCHQFDDAFECKNRREDL